MGRGQYIRAKAKHTVDISTGTTTAFLRKMGGLKHGFQETGGYTLTWHSTLTQRVIASMSCQITREAAIFSYHLSKNGDRRPVALTIPFTWTPCNYGGRRVWFACQCGHRAGKIFFEGERYGCRNCFNLTYQSRKDCQINRAWGKIYEIGKRLKLVESRDKSLYYLPPDRPKWMQQQRYERLCCDLQFWYYMKHRAIVADFENLFPGRLETLQ